jgi:transporter family-2 protein
MFYPLLGILVGSLTSIQSRVNGQLSADIHNGLLAALIAFGVGFATLNLIALFSTGDRHGILAGISALKHGRLKFWEVIGGLGGGFFVFAQSVSVPKIGVALFSIATIGGQTTSSLLVDYLGVSPRGKQPITLARIISAITALAAVFIAVAPDLGKGNFRALPILIAITVGVLVAFQHAVNSRLNEVSKRPFSTAWFNFANGFTLLLVTYLITLTGHSSHASLPTNPVLYLGGWFGLAFIAVAAFSVRHLGMLNFILFSVAGQLIGAIFIDATFPAHGAKVTLNLIAGASLTLATIAAGQYFEKRRTTANG